MSLQTDLLKEFLSKSKEAFIYEYSRYNKETATHLRLTILNAFKKAVTLNNIKNVTGLGKFINSINETKARYQPEDIFKETNLVILACKHSQLKSLEYLYNNYVLIKSIHCNISPYDVDDENHNAFYYAIRGGNIKILQILIDRWPNIKLEEIDDILSIAFEELKLKNVDLTNEMEIFVENTLINMRFYCDDSDNLKNIKVTAGVITERIDLILENINLLNSSYLHNDLDEKFFYIARFTVKNIHVLKRQMKSTYDILPWEEIEFCLIFYIASCTEQHEINALYKCVLSKERILGHLTGFAYNLNDVNNNMEYLSVAKLKFLPKSQRDSVISCIIKRYPPFMDLYNDYKEIIDIFSLNKIKYYTDLALAVDPKQNDGQLIIMRALQVMGEYMKNTLESPKLSSKTCELLFQSLKIDTREIVADLRNSLSHSYSLSRRTEIESNTDVNLYSNLQNDIKKVNFVITHILYNNKLKIIKTLLKRIMNSECSDEIKESIEAFKYLDLRELISQSKVSENQFELKQLIEELDKKICDKTYYEMELFQKIKAIIEFQEIKLCNNEKNYLVGLALLKSFGFKFYKNYRLDKDEIRGLKEFSAKALQCFSPNIETKNVKDIAKFLMLIYESISSRQNCDQFLLINKILETIEYNMDNVKWLEEFRDKLKENDVGLERECYDNAKSEFTIDEQLALKLKRMENILRKIPVKNYKNCDVKNLAALEMLLLDIMSILEDSKDRLKENFLYLDNNFPLLNGKNLRNHLAHGNSLIDILLMNPTTSIISNARKLTNENIQNIDKKIGKLVFHDSQRNKQMYNQVLSIIDTQNKMFMAIEEGNFEATRQCIQNGADIYARTTNLWTALHFAAKGPNLELVKFLVDQNLKVDLKDVDGRNALHIAVIYGRKNTVQIFLENKKCCINDGDASGKTLLHLAAQNNQKDIVELLYKNKATSFIKDMAGYSALHYAIESGHTGVAITMLRKEKNVDGDEIEGGFTPLHNAAERGHLAIVDYLLKNNANVNAKNDRGGTPLHTGALGGHADVVNMLIVNGSDVNSKMTDGSTPLHYAVQNNHPDIVELLIKCGADINALDYTNLDTPLINAAINGYTDIVEILLNNNASVNMKTIQHVTPLHFAAGSGNLDIVILLLKNKAVINSENMDGCTPLHLSAYAGHQEVVKHLIKNGCKVNATDARKRTPLHIAAANGNINVIKVLLLNKVDINSSDINGNTALQVSSAGGHEDIVKILIAKGANINTTNNAGSTPLIEALKIDSSTIIEMLLEAGANINWTDHLGFTTLHIASYFGSKSAVNILLKKNMFINAGTIIGCTPLHVAVENKQKEVIKILINARCDIDIKNTMNVTPLCLAARNNSKEILNILLANGADVNVSGGLPLSLAIKAGHKSIIKTLMANKKINLYAKDVENETFLHVAAVHGDKSIAEVLLREEVKVDAVMTEDKLTPLILAIAKNNIGVVEVLLANKANVNLKSGRGDTPLHTAVTVGALDIVELLLNSGAKCNVRDNMNRLPVDLAVALGHINIVKILLCYTDVNSPGYNGLTMLHIAAQQDNLKIAKLLVEKGANIHIRNASGAKPIHIAATEGSITVLEFLFDNKLSLKDYDLDSRNLLHFATLGRQLEILKFLINKKFDVNSRDVFGLTPLHLAACEDYEDVVEFLLNNGANYRSKDFSKKKPVELASNKNIIRVLTATERLFDAVTYNNDFGVEILIKMGAVVNVKNSDNVTPLLHATGKGYKKVVNVLLKYMANPNLPGELGCTPLHYAAEFGHLAIVKSLLANGAIFDLQADNNKTPLDVAKQKNIIDLLKLVAESFKNVQNKNTRVIKDLNKAQDIDTVRAVMNARNKDNKSIIVVAIHNDFPKIDDLKLILQEELLVYLRMVKDLKCKEKFKEALDIYNIILEKRQNILGPDNPATLDIQEEIALMLYKLQKFKEALFIFEEIYEKRRVILGTNDKKTLDLRSTIALTLNRLGKNEEALAIFKDVLKKQSELFGSNDVDVLKSQTHMVAVLVNLEKNGEALELNKEIYMKQKETYGINHPITLATQNNMAISLHVNGEFDEALKIFKYVYRSRKKVFGPTHSDTLRTFHNMVGVLLSQKKFDEALSSFKEVYDLQKSILGPNHIDTLLTQSHIGNALLEQGKLVSALQYFKECSKRGIDVLGPNHPYIIKTLSKIEVINHRLLLEEGTALRNMKYIDADINTVAARGDKSILESLILNGADVNKKDSEGRTPIHFAVDTGCIDTVILLLKNGADGTNSSNKGNTPLHIAASKGYKEIIKVLLNYVKQMNKNGLLNFLDGKTKSGGSTALHVAAKNNFKDVAMILLEYGATFNPVDNNNQAPQNLCTNHNLQELFKVINEIFTDTITGNPDIIKKIQILNHEMQVAVTNTRNLQGNTLLRVAMVNKHNDVARMIVQLLKTSY